MMFLPSINGGPRDEGRQQPRRGMLECWNVGMWAASEATHLYFIPGVISENKGRSQFAVVTEFTIDIVAINGLPGKQVM
jgi:hypothetical protein